jgi:hypothetical protein
VTTSTETDAVSATETTSITTTAFVFRRQQTVRPTAIPTYASECANAAEYSSACSCMGITARTSTVAAATRTLSSTSTSPSTVRVSQQTTSTQSVTERTTAVSTSVATTSATATTVTTTATTTVLVNRQDCVNGPYTSPLNGRVYTQHCDQGCSVSGSFTGLPPVTAETWSQCLATCAALNVDVIEYRVSDAQCTCLYVSGAQFSDCLSSPGFDIAF